MVVQIMKRQIKIYSPSFNTTNEAVCNREGASNILTCRHPVTGTILGLSNLPFTFLDETNCLLRNKQFTPDCNENPVDGTNNKFPLIPISCGCTIRVTFQPSMTVPFLALLVTVKLYRVRYFQTQAMMSKEKQSEFIQSMIHVGRMEKTIAKIIAIQTANHYQ